MESKSKDCPSCKQQIQNDASFCPYCGARFAITYQGYCPACHTLRDLDAANRCAVCGGDVIDRQPRSQYLGASQGTAGAPPAVPNLASEFPAPGKAAPNQSRVKKKSAGGCLGCARAGLALVGIGLLILLAAYYLSDDFRSQLIRLGDSVFYTPTPAEALGDLPQGEGAGAPQASATAAPTARPYATWTPDIHLPMLSSSAACAGEYGTGLTCLQDGGWLAVPPDQIPYTGRLGDLAACRGEVFLLASDNLYGFAGGKWTHYGQYGGSVTGVIACDAQDDLWIFDSQAAFHREGASWTEYVYDTVLNGVGYLSVKGVAVAAGGQVWAAGSENVVQYDGTRWTAWENKADLHTDYTLSGIAVDSQGAPWVTFRDGLATYDGQAWTKIAPPAATDVNTILIDPADQVWVGTDGGVSMYKDSAWQRYPVGKQGGSVKSLAMDAQGRLWAGTDWGLGVLENGAYTFYHMSNSGLLMNDIQHLVVLGGGPQLPEKADKETGELRGRLVDGDQPLGNARVEVCVQELGILFSGPTPCSGQPFMAATNADGEGYFSIPGLPAGYYVVTFQTPDGKWKVRSTNMSVGSVFLPVRPGEVNDLGNLDINK